ncbi:MAG TPA: 2-oxo-hepta-3-ene-1,7-dioic acid hydratase [Vineibacter sp.]|nr:2-oxo-hepta-3-ene-1,7-dioic acid hydratase [Vineibacter sp.]
MLDQSTIEAIARGYHQAEKTRQRVRPPTSQYPGFSIDDAYAVQRHLVKLMLADGRKIRGHKIGLTSRAMQSITGMNEPDYGVLLEDMFYPDGGELPVNRFIEPRLECELAFIIGKPLSGPNCTIFDVLSATDYVVPTVEIVDSRTLPVDPETKAGRRVEDSIADNAADAALVMGGRPVKPTEIDLRWVGVLCYRNGIIEESGVAAAVMNHPANGVAWLANKLAPHGIKLEPGQVVLGGSFTRTVPARAGDKFHIDYGPLGAITCQFV